MSADRNRRFSPLLVVLALAVLIGAGLTVWVVVRDGAAEPDPAEARERRAEERKRKLAEKSKQLKKMFVTKRPLPVPPKPPPWKRPPPEVQEPTEPAQLSHRQRVALKSAFGRFYTAAELAGVLKEGRAAEHAREVSQRFDEVFGGETIETGGGAIAVDDGMRQVIKRIGVVRDYTFNILHTQRPAGQEDRQAAMIERINESFKDRFDDLNSDYPFLNARQVEP